MFILASLLMLQLFWPALSALLLLLPMIQLRFSMLASRAMRGDGGTEDNLSFEESHGSKWRRIYMLATFGIRPGDAEDALINALRVRYGERRCSNVRGGGGGVSPYKPSLLYLCVGRL